MSSDLSHLLRDWPYEPGKINVRVLKGDNGRPLIQVRVGLGILQMYTDGRPDGAGPEGFESLLEEAEARADELDADEGDDDGENPGAQEGSLRLPADACQVLREEAALYYQRYVALLVLQDFEGVVRDTTRNLRVLDFLRRHAARDRDKASLESQRASILTIRARALAGQALEENQKPAALYALDQALGHLQRQYEAMGRPERFETSGEAQALRMMRDSLEPKLPVSQRSELQRRLDDALLQENYRLAAILRDELKNLDEEEEDQDA